MNMAPNGVSIMVSLREDLLKLLKDNPDLTDLDNDLLEIYLNHGLIQVF